MQNTRAWISGGGSLNDSSAFAIKVGDCFNEPDLAVWVPTHAASNIDPQALIGRTIPIAETLDALATMDSHPQPGMAAIELP